MNKKLFLKTAKETFSRDKIVFIIALVVALVSILVFRISPKKINNFSDVMSASLSFSSIGTAFLFAVFSIIPSKSNSDLLIALRQMNTDLKLMSRLLVSTSAYFLSSVLSFVELFFNCSDTSRLSIFVTGIWIASISLGMIETFILLYFLFLVLGNMFKDR